MVHSTNRMKIDSVTQKINEERKKKIMLTKMDDLVILAQCKMRAFLSDEKGEVNIVTTVILIGIAVTLAILFKDEITKLLKNLLSIITKNAEDAIK